jgi:hypothetical protein
VMLVPDRRHFVVLDSLSAQDVEFDATKIYARASAASHEMAAIISKPLQATKLYGPVNKDHYFGGFKIKECLHVKSPLEKPSHNTPSRY